MENFKSDIEIDNDAPKSAVTYCMYGYGDEMQGLYLNCERQFFDGRENKWVGLDLIDDYCHNHRRLKDIRSINGLKKRINVLKKQINRYSTYDSVKKANPLTEFTLETFPKGVVWVRDRANPKDQAVVTFISGKFVTANGSSEHILGYEVLKEQFEMSLDGRETWVPAGVVN